MNIHGYIFASQAIAFILGIVVTGIALNTYRKKGETYLRNAGIAFGLITMAVVIESATHHATPMTAHEAHVVRALLHAGAFLLIILSLRQ